MTKWEYQIIEVHKGFVNQVNNKVVNKDEGGFLSGAKLYTLDEYLSLIGQDGWEVIIYGNDNLLYNPDRKDPLTVLLAKRKIE